MFFSSIRAKGQKGKRAKNGPKWQNILSHSVSQELYLIWLWSLVHMCKIMSPAIFFHFFKILIFQVFQSSSINAKRKFWGVPCLLHMCVILYGGQGNAFPVKSAHSLPDLDWSLSSILLFNPYVYSEPLQKPLEKWLGSHLQNQNLPYLWNNPSVCQHLHLVVELFHLHIVSDKLSQLQDIQH